METNHLEQKIGLKKEIVKQNPVASIISPKTPKRLPQFVEQNDISNLISNIDFGIGFIAQLEKLIIEVLYNTGIRKSELLNLKE